MFHLPGREQSRLRPHYAAVGVGILCVLVLGASACSSSSSSAPGNGTSTSSAATSSASANGTSTSPALIQADEAAVAVAEAPVTKWQGPTDKLTPPKHESLAIVECASTVNGCVTPAEGAEAAAKALGWSWKIYDGQGTPADQNTAVSQAVASGANAILMVGIDPTAIQSSLQQAQAHNIPVGDLGQGVPPGNGIAFDVGANYAQDGQIDGEWIVAASDGKAVVLPTDDKEYSSTVEIVNGAISEIEKCSGCKLLPQQYFVSTDIGNGLGQRIASVVQQNPTVNYIIGAFDPAVDDMVPAFQNAGVASRLSLASNVGTPQNLGYIAQGLVEKADIVFDNNYMGWAGVDQIIRILLHKPLWKDAGVTNPTYMYDENTPSHLIVKSNLPPNGQAWSASFNTAALFEAHWGLG
jgi:ribose transport system substrate-binding protein